VYTASKAHACLPIRSAANALPGLYAMPNGVALTKPLAPLMAFGH
jgi:hypothetical protein